MQLFNFIIAYAVAATTPRIESRLQDLSKTSEIYLKPGLVSVLELPHNIIEVRVGNPNDLKVLISQVSAKEITLYFKNSHASPTNLIVRSDRKVYVFDVFPSSHRHQDYVKVTSGFGSPTQNSNLKLITSQSISPDKTKNETKLIEKGQL